mmetsp:Transcript_132171/g.254423  ORF Transcript_132171/g.254423 Transcript_132171/m.254423 type:complete len:294 (+) Transcript_132171:617-1498(+)
MEPPASPGRLPEAKRSSTVARRAANASTRRLRQVVSSASAAASLPPESEAISLDRLAADFASKSSSSDCCRCCRSAKDPNCSDRRRLSSSPFAKWRSRSTIAALRASSAQVVPRRSMRTDQLHRSCSCRSSSSKRKASTCAAMLASVAPTVRASDSSTARCSISRAWSKQRSSVASNRSRTAETSESKERRRSSKRSSKTLLRAAAGDAPASIERKSERSLRSTSPTCRWSSCTACKCPGSQASKDRISPSRRCSMSPICLCSSCTWFSSVRCCEESRPSVSLIRMTRESSSR